MKKLLLTLLILALVPLTLAATCSPDSGYEYCNEYRYDYGNAHAYVKLQMTNAKIEGLNRYINYKMTGDRYYIYKNFGTWDNIGSKCNENGCSGYAESASSSGRYYFTTDCIAIVAWDREDKSGDWAWVWGGIGWTGNGNCFTPLECQTGQEKCEVTSYFLCENNKWVSKGVVKGKCGAECLSGGDCGTSGYTGSRFCSGNNVVQKYREYNCLSNKCSYQDNDRNLEYCQYGCENGVCKVIYCTEGEKKCVGNDLMVCRNNQFSLQETCDYGCENNSCKSGPVNVLGILFLIIVVILIFGGLIFVLIRLMRRRK